VARLALPFAPYLRIRGHGSPRFAPGGDKLAFITNATGTTELWSLPASGGWPRQLTFAAERIWHLTYSPTRDVIVVARDRGGNERNQLYAVAGDGGGERALTDLPEVIHHPGAWSPDGRFLAFSANREHPVNYTVYVQDLAGDAATAVWRGEGTHHAVDWSPHGGRLLIQHMRAPGDHDLHVLELANGASRHVNPHASPARFAAAAFAAGGIVCLSDLGREFVGILHWPLDGGAPRWLVAPEADVDALRLSPDRRRAVYAVNQDGYDVLRLHDLDSGADRAVAGLPAGVLTAPPSWSPDGRRLAVSIATPTRPESIWVADLAAGTATEITPPVFAGIDPDSFVAPEVVRYPTFDGRRIPALYYRPRGRSGSLPVIVAVHGGPESQERPAFNAVYQYFLARGYAVFAPNVRGSTGYGRTYEHLDDGRSRLDAVRDLACGVDWLRAHGGADPRRIAVYGGSYGGFMVLAALTHHPELFAAGVDIVGIANLETLLRNTHPARRYLREAEYGSLERDVDFFRQISPIHHVDRIRAPLMVIHGRNDPRVPFSEAEQIVAALRARGRPVEFLAFDDEGHGVVRLQNRLVTYPAIADFLDRALAV
jgi:dipeptidyl aminopeptidase/acylaminoacyl peptidase